MRKITGILLLFISSLGYGQLFELEVQHPTQQYLSSLKNIERARAQYYAGWYTAAEQSFFRALEDESFTANDYLLFANALAYNEKQGLATEFYSEFRLSQQTTATDLSILDELEQIRFPNYTLTSSSDEVNLQNPRYHKRSFLVSVEGSLMEYDADCDGNLYNGRAVNLPITGNLRGVNLFANGTQAIVSAYGAEERKMMLYHLVNKGGKWKKPTVLFQEIPANYAFPFMDEENNTLFFASDRKGGNGGYDIYVSRMTNGKFSEPVNLGSQVNTPGHEIFPVRSEQDLYFSTNGRITYGGFDIYKYQIKVTNEYYSFAKNLRSINTEGNDYLYIPEGESAFFRFSGRKDSTILKRFKINDLQKVYSGIVQSANGSPIANASVLYGTNPQNGRYTVTNERGEFSISMHPDESQNMRLRIVAEGFKVKKASIYDSLIVVQPLPPEVVVQEVEKIIYQNIIRSDSIMPIMEHGSDSSVALEHTGIPITGSFYIIVGSFYNYTTAYEVWSKWIDVYDKLEILEYDHGLYRVAYLAGNNEKEAMKEFNAARIHKEDLWILRP